MGVSPERHRVLVVECACGTRWRCRDPHHRLACAIEADLADRNRRSGGGQRHQWTERLSRSEIIRIRLSAILPRRARRSHAGARAGGDPVAFRSRAERLSTGLQSRLGRRRPTHDRSRQYVRLGLGCAAVSGLSGFYLRVGGRRQLGNRALDHGQDRGRGARPADRCDSAGFRSPQCRTAPGGRVRGRLRGRPTDVGTRSHGAIDADVRHRRGGVRRRHAMARTRWARCHSHCEGRPCHGRQEPGPQAHPLAGN